MSDRPPLELVKIVCRSVVLIRDGDRIVGEEAGPEQACYSADEMGALWNRAEAEIAQANAARAAAEKPNRAARRKPPAAKR